MSNAAIEIHDDSLAINLATPPFSDVLIGDCYFGERRSSLGEVRVEPWSPERIDRFYRRRRRWQGCGRHVQTFAGLFEREVTGGLVGWLMRRGDVPAVEPSSTTRMIRGVVVDR